MRAFALPIIVAACLVALLISLARRHRRSGWLAPTRPPRETVRLERRGRVSSPRCSEP